MIPSRRPRTSAWAPMFCGVASAVPPEPLIPLTVGPPSMDSMMLARMVDSSFLASAAKFL